MENERTAFGTVLFGGFHKESVYRYIEQLVADFELKQKEFDRAKKELEAQLSAANQNAAKLEAELGSLRAEKEALTEALKQAQEAAEAEE
ncbi:MAG: hypothetical protein E7471_02525 [Ruminococcaceae bacterium]|nr:hypothetical protein [Oscillospiraceae bacterium]